MAGSLNHLIGSDGRFTMDTIDNLGDAREVLEECYLVIHALAEGNSQVVSRVCKDLGLVDPWENRYGDDPKKPMRVR